MSSFPSGIISFDGGWEASYREVSRLCIRDACSICFIGNSETGTTSISCKLILVEFMPAEIQRGFIGDHDNEIMKALEEEIKGIEVAMVEDQTFCISVHYQYIYCSSAGVYLKSDQLLHFETDAVDPKNRHRRKLETESLLESSKVISVMT
ncbi:hypothetical protein ACLB2K_077256 [Fragaria x ananassa]